MSFEALAAQLQKEYEETHADSRDWLPEDDGVYESLMINFRTGSFEDKKTGAEIPFISSSYELVGGDNDGAKYDGGMIALRNAKALEVAKRHLNTALGRRASGIFRDDCELLAEVCQNGGLSCKTKIVTNDAGYRNVYLQSAATLPVIA